jgi:hypothetical protein
MSTRGSERRQTNLVRVAGVLGALTIIVLSPVLFPFLLLAEGLRRFCDQFPLSYLGGRPKSGLVYGVLYPISLADLDQGLGLKVGFLGNASTEPTGENDAFHGEASSQ